LREGTWLQPAPGWHPGPTFDRLTLPLRLVNATDFPRTCRALCRRRRVSRFLRPDRPGGARPGRTETVPIELIAAGPAVSITAVNETARPAGPDRRYDVKGRPSKLPTANTCSSTWRHAAPRAAQPVKLDGDLGEWPAAGFTLAIEPMFQQEGWDVRARPDGRFRFAVAAGRRRFSWRSRLSTSA